MVIRLRPCMTWHEYPPPPVFVDAVVVASGAEHGAALPLPMVSGKRGRPSVKPKGVKRPLEGGGGTSVRKRKPRHTGLLARDGPLIVA